MDYGHGGRDSGYNAGDVKEKDLNLQIGQKIKKILVSHGIEVCTVRDDDEYVPLDVRTARIKECQGASLLISIHINASTSKKVQGIETFYNHHTLFDNKLSMGNNKLKSFGLKFDKVLNDQSKNLAELVHENILIYAAKKNPYIIDRGIKNKAAQLLFGVEIPAVLIECGFLSHPFEGKLLRNNNYQENIAKGVVKAIEKFFHGQFA